MEANKRYHLPVDDLHQIYVEEWGNPCGIPLVFLHGGPGGAVSEKNLVFFDLNAYYVILFDQRGCGKSQPFLELKDNTVEHSVSDMEVLRKHIGIEQWIVFGGSYGSTLALAYAINHPQKVLHLVLRGIFLGRKEDIDWLFQEGAGYFYPEEFERYKRFIKPEKQSNLVAAYYDLLRHEDENIRNQASLSWANWECAIVSLLPNPLENTVQPWHQSLALLECHYFVNHMFWENDNYLLENVYKIKDIPMDIVHGRYDVDCRPVGAYLLAQACPKAKLWLSEAAGHSPYDEANKNILIDIMKMIACNCETYKTQERE